MFPYVVDMLEIIEVKENFEQRFQAKTHWSWWNCLILYFASSWWKILLVTQMSCHEH